ncbi:MAG TPA: hypothetical protein VLF95_02315 [Vicinamibacteria bacterium]|nr:hypothetical protein [Vicinamibacteria bacterium]
MEKARDGRGVTRPGAAWRWLGPALALAFVLAPSLFWAGGVIEEEALGFLRNYWGDRTVLQRIFDPRGYDYYQGRELSYAIDFLDAQWVRLVMDRGWLYFVPPSALAASLAVVFAWGIGLPRAMPGLDRVTAWCLLLVYLSNFAVLSTMGLLYRSAKPLVPPLLLTVLLFVLRELREPRAGPRTAFAWVYLPCLTMSLLDRQGLFYTACLVAVLAVVWVRTRRGALLPVAGAAAAATWALYNYLLGPWIIHAANGYWPEFRFQRFRPSWLMRPQPWLSAGELLRDWTSVLFGSFPLWLPATAGVALFVLHLRWRRRGPDRSDARMAAVTLLAVAAQVAMVAVMVQRHDPVTWIDHRAWYYPLPFQALVVLALAWALERVARARGGTLPRMVPALLALVVVANVTQWPARRLVMESGPWFGDVSRRSERLERSFRAGQADPLLDGDYRRFFFESLSRFPRFGARAGVRVEESAGVEPAELRAGRLFAWAQREAHLVADVPATARYRLAGALWLRGGDTASIILGSQPPRLLAEIRRTAPSDGSEPFTLTVPLPAGRTDFMVLSRLPEMMIRREKQRISVAFGLQLPVAVWPVAGEPSAP